MKKEKETINVNVEKEVKVIISDVIVYGTLLDEKEEESRMPYFQNLVTGKHSKNLTDVKRNDTRNIICLIPCEIFDLFNTRTELNGFFMQYDEESDSIVFYASSISFESLHFGETRDWDAAKAVASVKKDGTVTPYRGMNTILDRIEAGRLSPSGYVDMTTETLYFDIGDPQYGAHATATNYSHELAKKFFGTGTIAGKTFGEYSVIAYQIWNLLQQLATLRSYAKGGTSPLSIKRTMKKNPSKEEKRIMDELLSYELPETEKVYALKLFTWQKRVKGENTYTNIANNMSWYMKEKLKIAYVQHATDGIGVIRIFAAYATLKKITQNISLDDIETEEIGRMYLSMDRAPIYLEKHLDGWKWSNAEGRNTQNTYMMPWKKEDAVDTPLELLTDYVRTKFGVLALIDKDRAEEDPEEYAHQKWMQYGFFNEVFTFIRNPYAPSIVRCGLPNILNMFQKELSMKSVESIIHDMFGISDFHKPYGADIMKESTVSPHMLKSYERILEKLDKHEYVGNDEIILSGIPRSMENIFLSAPEYFKNMNAEQYESLASLLAEKLLEYQDSLPSRDAVDVLQYLVALNGPKNVKGYINHICNIARDAKAESSDPKTVIRWYSDYIRILLAMKDLNEDDKEELNITIKLDWKIKGTERIQERHEEVIYIYNSLSNEILCRQYNEAFERTSKKWLGYDYSEDEFSVILPQNPLEIAYEGLSLNHCVKSYIEDVSNGKTNIFFVRRTNDLKKPFYTLEVRDNAIRQCHGFNNKNTDEVAGLADFIRRYCEAKGITCKGMNRVLAV